MLLLTYPLITILLLLSPALAHPTLLLNNTTHLTLPLNLPSNTLSSSGITCYDHPPAYPINTYDCYPAIASILQEPSAADFVNFKSRAHGRGQVPRQWASVSCEITLDNIYTQADDTFQMMLVARQAALVVKECMRPRAWGGYGWVGQRQQFIVEVTEV